MSGDDTDISEVAESEYLKMKTEKDEKHELVCMDSEHFCRTCVSYDKLPEDEYCPGCFGYEKYKLKVK